VTQKHLPSGAIGLFFLAIVAGLSLSSQVQGNEPHDKSTKVEPPSFLNDLIPILTKVGCNAGACHGSQYGKGGFKLSLLGYDPDLDHASIARELLGRRIVLSDPEQSLLLLKASGAVPHEGGVRLTRDSLGYATLLAWLREGAPGPASQDRRLVGITMKPAEAVLRPAGRQQFQVLAHYDDGLTRDVTRWARFFSNHDNVATVDEGGLATVAGRGEAVLRAHFGTEVASARLLIPLADDKPADRFPVPVNCVDEAVFAKLRRLGIAPSPVAGDAEFLRRVTLDLIGLLPTPDEVRAFLASQDPNKRQKWIESLLERPEYADFWTCKLGDLFRCNRRSLGIKGMIRFHGYLHDAVASNRHWDKVAQELITGQGSLWDIGPANFYGVGNGPEDWAENVSQVFLGVRIGCARCHNHPFDRWTQHDYYSFVAFFARQKTKVRKDRGDKVVYLEDEGEVKHPKTGTKLPPRVLGSDRPLSLLEGADRREALANWLTAPENPWFARAAVNRIWQHLMGRGLIEPADDLRATNLPSNQAVLDALAGDFVTNDYDLKQTMRVICNSATYQLSSESNATNKQDETQFSRRLVRRLTAEQFLDAVVQVTGVPEKFPGVPLGTRAAQLPDTAVPSYFLDLFGRPPRQVACTCEREMSPNLAQTLHVMNNDSVNAKIRSSEGRLSKLLATGMTDVDVLEDLFLATLTRFPTAVERDKALGTIRQAPSRKEGFSDLLWALLNARAFAFSH
jgi:hypothetical protein